MRGKTNVTKNPMLRYILKRLVTMIPVLIGVTLITYGLMYISPSDPVEMLLQAQGVPVSEEVVEAMRVKAGLDQPFLVQYGTWLWNFIRGDMGVSLVNGTSIGLALQAALPKTLILTLSSMLVTVIISIPLGIYTAIRQNRFSDYVIRVLGFVGNAMPSFLVSLLLMYFMAIKLKWLPVLASDSFVGLIMPTLALAIPMTGKYIRQVRAAVLEQLGKSYVDGAISRGINPKIVLFKDVLRNSLVTIVTLMALSIGSLLGGTAAVECIFSWRGVGYMVMDSIQTRDYPMIQAFVVWMAIIYVLVNLAADISYYLLDPRIRKNLGVE